MLHAAWRLSRRCACQPRGPTPLCRSPEDTTIKCTYYTAACFRIVNVLMGILVAAGAAWLAGWLQHLSQSIISTTDLTHLLRSCDLCSRRSHPGGPLPA